MKECTIKISEGYDLSESTLNKIRELAEIALEREGYRVDKGEFMLFQW